MKIFGAFTTCCLVALTLFGCASTEMTSFKDPAFGNASFKRVLIIANISDLQWRQKVEARMVEAFKSAGIFAVEGVRFFPPTRTFTNDEKVELLVHSSIDAYLSISVGETGTEQVYVPPTGSTTKTSGTVSVYGNRATYQEKSTTTVYGGYTLSKPWAEFDTRLFDVSSGMGAWLASSFTGGNAYANFNTVVGSYCDKTVEQLLADGLIAPEMTETQNILVSQPMSTQDSTNVDKIFFKNGEVVEGKVKLVRDDAVEFIEKETGLGFLYKKSTIERILTANGKSFSVGSDAPQEKLVSEPKRDTSVRQTIGAQRIELGQNSGEKTFYLSVGAGYALVSMSEVNADMQDTYQVLVSARLPSSPPNELKGGLYLEGTALFRAGQLLLGTLGSFVQSAGDITYTDYTGSISEKYSTSSTELMGVVGGLLPVGSSVSIVLKAAGGYGLASCTYNGGLVLYSTPQNNITSTGDFSNGYFAGRVDGGLQFDFGRIGLSFFVGYRYAKAGELTGKLTVNGVVLNDQPITNVRNAPINFDYSGVFAGAGIGIGF